MLGNSAQEGRIVRDQSAFNLAGTGISNEERTNDFDLTQIDVAVGFRCIYAPEGG